MKKVKNSILLMLLCCIGWAMTGCSDDKDDVPGPEKTSFSHVKALLRIKVEGETTQCFNVTGEWECNGEEMAMAPLNISADQSYKPVDSKKLPSTYSMTLNVTPNKEFVPEEGKKYNAIIRFSYDIMLVDTKGNVMLEKEGEEHVMNMRGIKPEMLEDIAERFPESYVFTVKQTSEGKYEITDEVI